MATFYQGYRNVLKGRSDAPNTFTGLLGKYSNWDLMNPSHVLDGAPDHNHVPGSGPYGQGNITLTRWFLGLDTQLAKSSMKNAGILHPDVYSGRWNTWLFRGTPSSAAFPSGYGHLPLAGPMSDYAGFSNYIYMGVAADQAFTTSTLGHAARYPTYSSASTLGVFNSHPGASASFGSFAPYVYKGLSTEKSNPMGPLNTGHPRYASSVVADAVATDYGQIPAARTTVEHYGFEHVREWFGVPSAKAL